MCAKASKEITSNRRAFHDYEILESFETGIVLQGTEVKSLRENGASLQEAYVKVLQSELWLIGASIPPYRHGNIYNHEERRDRKLLMHRREIQRLKSATQEKGLTLVPLALYFKSGVVKLKIATARGKKMGDKREAIREKEEKRRMQKMLKQHLYEK